MLEAIKPEQVDADCFAQLYAADSAGPAFNSIPPPEMVRRIWSKEILLFGMPTGIMAVEVNQGGDGTKRLNLVRMAGKDLTLHFEEISRDLQHIAREHGCVAIETMVYDEKLARALARGGAKQESVTMVLELNDGQEQD